MFPVSPSHVDGGACLVARTRHPVHSRPAGASSHREAPGITEMPKVDGTDFYAFRSYEAGRAAYTTLIANYLPLQDAYGGPNYFALDPDAAYRIHIDNTGDGVEDITFQFLVRPDLRDIKVPAGGKQVSIPLINAGQITGDPNSARVSTPRELHLVAVLRGPVTADQPAARDHDTAAASASTSRSTTSVRSRSPTTTPTPTFVQEITPDSRMHRRRGRVFVGQRKDPSP